MRTITGALVAVANHGLAPPPEPAARLGGPEQLDLLDAIAEHRLTGVAVRAFESGALDLDDEAAATLMARHDVVMAQTMRVELSLLEVAKALEQNGLEYRVLKGSALAHLAAVDPADREFRDVDLLIRSRDIDAAVGVLEDLGARRIQPALSRDFDRRFAKSVTMRLAGIEIDIHRTLAPGPFGVWSYPGDLFVLRQHVVVADRRLATLDPTDHLIHACYHVSLGQSFPAFTNLRDIVLLADGRWDDERFGEVVDRWQGRPAIARAVRLVQRLLDCDLPDGLAAYTPRPGDGELLRPYLSAGERFPELALATLRALPRSHRPAFARAVALPLGSDPVRRVRDLWGGRPRR